MNRYFLGQYLNYRIIFEILECNYEVKIPHKTLYCINFEVMTPIS